MKTVKIVILRYKGNESRSAMSLPRDCQILIFATFEECVAHLIVWSRLFDFVDLDKTCL